MQALYADKICSLTGSRTDISLGCRFAIGGYIIFIETATGTFCDFPKTIWYNIQTMKICYGVLLVALMLSIACGGGTADPAPTTTANSVSTTAPKPTATNVVEPGQTNL
jgi:hypothetical protein